MIINKSFKFRVYPTREQKKELVRQFDASRFVYNYFLRQRIDFYVAHRGEKKQSLNYNDTSALLTQLKKQPEYNWLRDTNAQSLQQSLRNLDIAYNNFFNKRTEFPRFKSKRAKQSFHVPQSFSVNVENEHLIIPKITPLKIVLHRHIEGKMKGVTISRSPSGNYFASILCEVEINPSPKSLGHTIGLDLGLKHFAISSDGAKIDSPRYFRVSERRLSRFQRNLSRKKNGSRGQEKARLKVARQHEKIVNQRIDFLHKLSRRLVDESQAIYVEDLNVKGMIKNRALAKSIGDSGWGEFVRWLEYKGRWNGCYIGKIDRFFPSSKRCHKCGYIYQDLRLSEREWTCPECGNTVDRDENAAQNILIFGEERRAGMARTHTRGKIRRRIADPRSRMIL